MSLSNTTNVQFNYSLDGLTELSSDSIIVNGQTIDPSLYVKYSGNTSNTNLGNYNLTTNGYLTGSVITGTSITGTSISGTNITGTSISGTNIIGTNITGTIGTISNSITATSPSVYLTSYVQYISGSQLLVYLSSATDPYIAGDVLNIEDNFYRGQVVYQSNASSSSFYVSNPGYGNSGTKYGGSISINKGIINSNITRNKQNVINSLYTFKTDPSNSNLQLLYNSDSNFYYTPAGRFRANELDCKTAYCVSVQATGDVSYPYGGNTWSTYQTSGNNFNIDFNSVNKVFIDTAGKLGATSFAFTNNLITNTTTLTSAEVSTLTGINTGTTIQAQINAIPVITNYLQKTGTTTGVNCRFTLSSGGVFDVYSGSGVLFSIGQTLGKTFIFDLSSTSQINGRLASYYDVSSSIQGLLDSKINLNGLTVIQVPVLRFTSSGNYVQIQDEKSNELVSFTKTYNTFTQESFFNNTLATAYCQLRIANGTGAKTAMFHNNGTEFYILFSNAYSGIYNALRPFYINMTTGLLYSNNSQTFQGLTNLQNIQFNAIPGVPNGITTEVVGSEGLINLQINFRNTTDRTVDSGVRGIFFRLDNRAGVTPFQWYFRPNGSLIETQIMGLDSNGDLTTGRKLICQTPSASVQALNCKTFNTVGTNQGMSLGYDSSNYNTSMFSFNYTSSGSSSNFLGIGLYGFYERFKLYSNKAIFEDQVTVPSIKVGSGVISGQINPYILSRTEAYNAMEYGETMSCVIYDQVAWTTGSTYISWFKKFTNNSTLSFVGNVTAYSSSANQNIYWRITFDNLTDGSSYVHEYSFYFNQAYIHTTLPCVGVVSSSGNSGFGTFCTAGIYTVTFVRLNTYMQSDTGDSINIHFMITPNFRGK
jgi:hypothetical protein